MAQRSGAAAAAGSGWARATRAMFSASARRPAAASDSAARADRGSRAGSAGAVSSSARTARSAAVAGAAPRASAAAWSRPSMAAVSPGRALASRCAPAATAEPPRASSIPPNWRCRASRAGSGTDSVTACHTRPCRKLKSSVPAASRPACSASFSSGSSAAGASPSISATSSSRNDRPSTAAVSSSGRTRRFRPPSQARTATCTRSGSRAESQRGPPPGDLDGVFLAEPS